MFKQLYNEATLTLRIEPEGPMLIKAGEGGADPTRPDMEFVRTIYQGRETIYLPGSSLKGVIRAHCERLARTVQPDDVAGELSKRRLSCDPLHEKISCSQQWEKEKEDLAGKAEEIYRRSCFVCRLFGNTRLASRMRVTDAYPDDPERVKTEERNGVAIDRVFGSVAVGPFNYEVATSGTFTCRIQVRNFTIAQLGLLALALRDFEMQRVGVGFAKSRGLGMVKACVTEVAFRYPACTLKETLTLPGSNKPGTPPTQLAGAGKFIPGESYGLDDGDSIALPDGVVLTADDWGEPYVTLTDDAQIKALWRECVKAWRQVVEQVVGGRW
ncbi:MAG: CRISPR-associated protein [Firmicutes bacterium]|nr:CRISPR-associated protein [Bacillota bacterium]